ncbi:MAG: hypothetical protein K9N52_05170 [Verrucomicrobia bacterium]|nr:hypothetical protein [Verrucomicrobiota bacterium]
MNPEELITSLVLKIHKRNGGVLRDFSLDMRLMESALMIDSLDMAEIMVEVEREFGISPFDQLEPPRTWRELIGLIEGRE